MALSSGISVASKSKYSCKWNCKVVNLAGYYITCHLANAFIQSDLQFIRLSRRHTTWSNVGLRALLKGPTAVQIFSWPHQASNHRPCRSKSSTLTTTLQTAPRICRNAVEIKRMPLLKITCMQVWWWWSFHDFKGLFFLQRSWGPLLGHMASWPPWNTWTF